MKGFKGFDNNLTCRNFKYEIGKEYEHKGTTSLCQSGFHFCENPMDVLGYYGPTNRIVSFSPLRGWRQVHLRQGEL